MRRPARRALAIQDVLARFDRIDRGGSPRRSRCWSATNPYGFLLNPLLAGSAPGQAQKLEFLASGGRRVVDPDGGGGVFEVPVRSADELLGLHF